jgi:sucrose phosphorylase
MKFKNEIMLITYADSMGKNLNELNSLLGAYFSEAVGGVHILPFFPSSADRGFAPTRYDRVEETFGDWDDMEALSRSYYLMFDFMVNHISRSSRYFQDFIEKKDASAYKDMFIRYRDFWPGGEPTQADVDKIYKRKPRAPYITAVFGDGTEEKIWCTFDREQIDLNLNAPVTRDFIRDTVVSLAKHQAAIIRLDAFAYAVKKPGSDCFFVEPEIWQLISSIQDTLKPYGTLILPEIHEHYSIQMKLAEHGYWVYDFALPMLLLHTLYTGSGERLKHWLNICPRRQFTTLDTHDGIGVVDVKDLLSDGEIAETKELLFKKGANVKKVYNTAAYNNLDIYQLNCTYYSALGDNDDAYLLARAIQFFAPGVPQVYYVGMLAGKNDIELMEKTRQGRDINRHGYTADEVAEEVKRPVVKKLLELMRFRNQFPAFDGSCEIEKTPDHILAISRTSETAKAVLRADLRSFAFEIEYSENGAQAKKLLF